MNGDLTLTPGFPYLWSGISLDLLLSLLIPGMSCDPVAQRHAGPHGRPWHLIASLSLASMDGWPHSAATHRVAKNFE